MENNIRDIVYDVYEKAMGVSELDWAEICEKHSLQIHPETLRKAGVGIRMAADAGCLDFSEGKAQDYADIYKAKQQFYDQRRLYNKSLRDEARADYLVQELTKTARSLRDMKPLPVRVCRDWLQSDAPNDAVLLLSDWHYGMKADNVWGKFDIDIADRRIARLRDEVACKLQENRVARLYIVLLGDMTASHIHTSIRIESMENTVDQLMHVSERIADLTASLALLVPEVYVYSTFGNHARVTANLADSIHGDNYEKLIPFWLKERFAPCGNITVMGGAVHELVGFDVKGYHLCGTHGDLDTQKDAVLTLNALYKKNYGHDIDVLLTGHLHEHKNLPVLNIECVQSGCLCGVDEYAKNKRLFNRPSQTLLIFDDDGIDSVHNIMLDKA